MKTYAIALVCLSLGFLAGQITVEKARIDAIQETSDATLMACERKIDQITTAANDAEKTAYNRGFNDCLAQF